MNFIKFSKAIHKQYNLMQSSGLLLETKAGANSSNLWELYLNSFPEGSDPLYIQNTVHNCNCCKSFIARVGHLVTIVNGKAITIWDNWEELEYPYNEVSRKLYEEVISREIKKVFRTKENSYGKEITFTLDHSIKPKTFNHFFCKIQDFYITNKPALINDTFIPAKTSLTTISLEAVDIVLDLVKSNSIYRGLEFLEKLKNFRVILIEYKKVNNDLYIWQNLKNLDMCIKNTVIGTLLVDVSSNINIEAAIKSYENKVAPLNYKRPKALITKAMIESATKTIKELGIEDSLYRRLAVDKDIPIEHILYKYKSSKKVNTSILASIEPQKVKPVNVDKLEKVYIDDFLATILPKTKELEIYFNREVENSLVSLTANEIEASKNIFSWDNKIAWSYRNNTTDSMIKEKVKNAGGIIDAEFRVSLSWEDSDDLDLALTTPDSETIKYSKRRSKNGLIRLDIDMHASVPVHPYSAVENIYCKNFKDLQDGVYKVRVHNYCQRNNDTTGFSLEICIKECSTILTYNTKLKDRDHIYIELEKTGSDMKITSIPKELSMDTPSKEVWGLRTNTFHKVKIITLSPNYWGNNNRGNRHLFFFLENCKVSENVRGIYNEYLNKNLLKNKKFFEVLGEKSICKESVDQIAGLGFSYTKKQSIPILCDKRAYLLTFN